MFENCKNTKEQGNTGLGLAVAYFCTKRLTVSLPLNDSQDYDLVLDLKSEGLKKIQIKTTRYKTPFNNYCVSLRVNGGNSKINYVHKKANEVIYDYLFVLDGDGNKYFIPKEDIKNITNAIVLGKKYEKYKLKD